MSLSAQVIRDEEWGVKVFDDGKPLLAISADSAIKLGIHLIILGQDALHGQALEMVCLDKKLPQDTFTDLWNRVDQYVTILNMPQKDVDGNDSSD